MKEFVLDTLKALSSCSPKDWAVIFVSRRLEFNNKFSKGLVFSTVHGADFFYNVLNCLNGQEWNEGGKDADKTLRDNFRKLIKTYKENV